MVKKTRHPRIHQQRTHPNKSQSWHLPGPTTQQAGGLDPSPVTALVDRPGYLSHPHRWWEIFSGRANSSRSSRFRLSGVGIVNNKNPNLFGDLLSSALGANKSSNNVPLKNAAPDTSQNTFQMGDVTNSLPKTGNSGNVGGNWGSNVSGNVNFGGNYNKSSSVGGGNVNLDGNSTRNPNLGRPSMKNTIGVNGGNKDSFGSLVDFASKPPGGMDSANAKSGLRSDSFVDTHNTTSKTSGSSFSSGAFPTSNNDPLGFTSQQFSEDNDWVMNSEFGGGNDTTTSLKAFLLHLQCLLTPQKSMEKYKLVAEDLRTVMKLDPGNRVARSTIHRLTKMAG
ncbi:hypothetical protein DH2020_043663 [Rehmannia glutinosa]|uniref:Uncharacterized protein n=1 Tax=Rehmannia glutinosa TaxID=99300 RepID=A0ABR0UKS0_REHGL